MKGHKRDFFKAKYFQKKDEADDDIDDLEDCFFTKKSKFTSASTGKSKVDNKKRNSVTVVDETEAKQVYSFDQDDDTSILSKYAENSCSDVSGVLDLTSKEEENSSINKANDILKSVAEKKKKYITSSSSSNSSSGVSYNDANDTQSLNISIPTIKTASQRRAIAQVVSTASSSSSSIAISPVQLAIKRIKIRTRINGKAHLTWLVPHNLHFDELRKCFAAIVTCQTSAFQFDGESLEAKQTPDDFDMGDDDIIDVKIDKKLVYETVIQGIESKLLAPSSIQSSGDKVSLIEYSNGKTNHILNIHL